MAEEHIFAQSSEIFPREQEEVIDIRAFLAAPDAWLRLHNNSILYLLSICCSSLDELCIGLSYVLGYFAIRKNILPFQIHPRSINQKDREIKRVIVL